LRQSKWNLAKNNFLLKLFILAYAWENSAYYQGFLDIDRWPAVLIESWSI